jgi:hypothetical protein
MYSSLNNKTPFNIQSIKIQYILIKKINKKGI